MRRAHWVGLRSLWRRLYANAPKNPIAFRNLASLTLHQSNAANCPAFASSFSVCRTRESMTVQHHCRSTENQLGTL